MNDQEIRALLQTLPLTRALSSGLRATLLGLSDDGLTGRIATNLNSIENAPVGLDGLTALARITDTLDETEARWTGLEAQLDRIEKKQTTLKSNLILP